MIAGSMLKDYLAKFGELLKDPNIFLDLRKEVILFMLLNCFLKLLYADDLPIFRQGV